MRTSTKRKITHVNQSGLRKTVKKSITLTLIIKEIKYLKREINCASSRLPQLTIFQFYHEVKQAEEDKNLKKKSYQKLYWQSSTGFLQSQDKVLQAKVQDKIVYTKDVQSEQGPKFQEIINKNENCIAYRQKQVFRYIDMKAVEASFVQDRYFSDTQLLEDDLPNSKRTLHPFDSKIILKQVGKQKLYKFYIVKKDQSNKKKSKTTEIPLQFLSSIEIEIGEQKNFQFRSNRNYPAKIINKGIKRIFGNIVTV